MGIERRLSARHRWSVAVLAAAAAVVLAGCGTTPAAPSAPASAGTTAPSSGAGVQNVTLWESHSAGGPPGKAVAALVQEFNRTHPDIRVILTVTKASHKALPALAAGDAPVIAAISHYDGNFLSAHALVSWNSFLGGPNGMPQSERKAIFPVMWHNGEVGGQHYRLEMDAKVSQLTYNKSLFTQAGIAGPPATWTQLAADVATLKQRFPKVIPLAWKDSSAHILPPFLSNGGQLFQPGSGNKRADFLSPAAVQTFGYFRKLYASGEMIFAHGTQIRADFGAGRLAIADGTSAGYQKILDAAGGKFPVGVFAYPAGSSGHTANLVQGLGFALMKGHSAAQDRAAATFMAWWFGAKPQAFWGMHSGYPPSTTQGQADISRSFLSSHPGIGVALQILKSRYTISRPVPSAYKEVQTVLNTAFYNAVTGKAGVHAALRTLQTQADAYLSGKSAL